MSKISVVHATGSKCTISYEGISSRVMRNTCICKGLIDCQLCCHDHVIGRSKYCIHTICDQCACCSDNFIIGACCLLFVSNSLLIQICFCIRDRLCGVCLGQRVEKSDFLYIRVLFEHHIHDKIGVQCIRSTRYIIDSGKLCCIRIRNCCVYNRCLCLFCTICHHLCCQCCDRNDHIYIFGDHLSSNLIQN